MGGAAIPIAMILTWPRMSTVATVVTPWIGLAFGLTAWLVVTSLRSGSITVATTGIPINAVAGNIASLMTGLLFALALSFIFPWKFTSSNPADIDRANKIKGINSYGNSSSDAVQESAPTDIETGEVTSTATDSEKPKIQPDVPVLPVVSTGNELVDYLSNSHIEPMDPVTVRKATRIVVVFNAIYIFIAVLLVPYTFFGSSWIFSRAGFKGWCVVSFIWVWVSMGICVFWPLVESRQTIARISKGLVGAMFKRKV